jgi:hypothetical protein
MKTTLIKLSPCLIIALSLICFNQHAYSQPTYRGVDIDVHSLATDQSGNVYAGGYFIYAGNNVDVMHIAVWNPNNHTWSALVESPGSSKPGVFGWFSFGYPMPQEDGDVRAIAIGNNGKVYVGGYFSAAGGRSAPNIAVWDPVSVTWTNLGSGIYDNFGGMNSSVNAMTIWNNKLYVVGSFSMAGGIAANNIAVWDIASSTWSNVGCLPQNIGTASAIATPDGLNFYVGGNGGIFHGTLDIGSGTIDKWQPMGSLGGAVNAIAITPTGRLFVGGRFSFDRGISYCYLAEWTNAFFVLVQDAQGEPEGGCTGGNCSYNEVHALSVVDDNLIIGGRFELPIVFPFSSSIKGWVENISRFNLTTNTWFVLGPGSDNGVTGVKIGNNVVCALASGTNWIVETNGFVSAHKIEYVGGSLDTIVGNGDCVDNLAAWDSVANAWSILGNNIPPTVSITSPVDRSVILPPVNTYITANAADIDCAVANVAFYVNGVLLGNVASSPYSIPWNNVPPGTYLLTAQATDTDGAMTTSAAVSVRVDAPPTVSITSPANGAVFSAPASITINANANDSDGTVSRVDFYQGSTLIGTGSQVPNSSIWTFTWTSVPVGTYSLTARATDNNGAVTTSAARSVSVIVDVPPTVSITSPGNGAVFTAPANIPITANAASGNQVMAVLFYQGTTLIGSDTTAPYSTTWNNVPPGTYTLTAKAVDNRGVMTTSTGVTIQVQ